MKFLCGWKADRNHLFPGRQAIASSNQELAMKKNKNRLDHRDDLRVCIIFMRMVFRNRSKGRKRSQAWWYRGRSLQLVLQCTRRKSTGAFCNIIGSFQSSYGQPFIGQGVSSSLIFTPALSKPPRWYRWSRTLFLASRTWNRLELFPISKFFPVKIFFLQ